MQSPAKPLSAPKGSQMALIQHFRHFRADPSTSSSFSYTFHFTALFPRLNRPNSAKPTHFFIVRPLSCKRTTSATTVKSLTFTADYLVQSCGLSPDAAAAASKRVQFCNPAKPDSVLALLRSHGFSSAQISKLVSRRPTLLLAAPESSLRPKLEFFYSIGISRSELAKILSRDPTPLCRSLRNQILPSYEFLLSFLESDKKVELSSETKKIIFPKTFCSSCLMSCPIILRFYLLLFTHASFCLILITYLELDHIGNKKNILDPLDRLL